MPRTVIVINVWKLAREGIILEIAKRLLIMLTLFYLMARGVDVRVSTFKLKKFVLETTKSRVRPVCPNIPRSFFLSLSKWLSFRPPNQRTKRQSTIGARNLARSSNIFSAKYRVCEELKLLRQTTFNSMV